MGYTKSTFYPGGIKVMVALFCLGYIFSFNSCDETDDDDGTSTPPALSTQAKKVVNYLSHNWDSLESIKKCDTVDVTSFYNGFRIVITDVALDTDNSIILNYSVINGDPAFQKGEGTIAFARSTNFEADQIEGLRDDGKKIFFTNMNLNIDSDSLHFDLEGTADDACSNNVGRAMLFKGHSILIKR